MLVLDATTKSIVVAMSGAAATTNPDFVTTYQDFDGVSIYNKSNDGALNGTSSVTIVAAPSGSNSRTIKTMYIENKDTANVTLTVSYNNNSTLRTLANVTLQTGDTWSLEGTTNNTGSVKTAVPGVGTMAYQNSNNVTITGGTINVYTTAISSNTAASATFATSSLPLVPAGYINVDLNGTIVKVPYYAV